MRIRFDDNWDLHERSSLVESRDSSSSSASSFTFSRMPID